MRLVVTLLLIVLATPAQADWVRMGIAKGQHVTHYYDPTTIERRGNKVRVWKLVDFEEPRELGASSARYLVEFDCNEGTGHSLSFTWHSGRMASGDILASRDTPGKWAYLPPTSIGGKELAILCK